MRQVSVSVHTNTESFLPHTTKYHHKGNAVSQIICENKKKIAFEKINKDHWGFQAFNEYFCKCSCQKLTTRTNDRRIGPTASTNEELPTYRPAGPYQSNDRSECNNSNNNWKFILMVDTRNSTGPRKFSWRRQRIERVLHSAKRPTAEITWRTM